MTCDNERYRGDVPCSLFPVVFVAVVLAFMFRSMMVSNFIFVYFLLREPCWDFGWNCFESLDQLEKN